MPRLTSVLILVIWIDSNPDLFQTAAERNDAVKHAYAAAKLLAQRADLMTFDLLLTARPVFEPAVVERLLALSDYEYTQTTHALAPGDVVIVEGSILDEDDVGAALAEPKPAFSTITASATVGCSSGAKAT